MTRRRVSLGFLLKCCCLAMIYSNSMASADEEEKVQFAYPMNDPQDASEYHILQMVNWLNDMDDGYFNPKIQIRRAFPGGYFGVFAAEDLAKDELLMFIPPEARIHGQRDGEYTEVLCELAWKLRNEFDLGYSGNYIHYVNYLKQQRRDIIPAVWSQEAKDLLMKVQDELYMKDYEPSTAPATHLIDWIDEWFLEPCLMDPRGRRTSRKRPESLHPYFLAVVTQRGFDNMLVPIYDFFNHHNDNVNIYNDMSIYHRDGFDVYAKRDVKAGEELFFSYHNCPDCKECIDCDASQAYWGTPEMLRDFGFVEPYPHTFYLGDYMTFVVSNATLGTQEPKLTDLSIEYMDNTYPSFEIYNEAKREMIRLEAVYQHHILKADTTKIAPHELYTIKQYFKALSNAFKVMVSTFDPETAETWEDEEDEVVEEEKCVPDGEAEEGDQGSSFEAELFTGEGGGEEEKGEEGPSGDDHGEPPF